MLGAVGGAIGLPAFLCFNFIYRFAVDVPYWDQWALVPLLQKWGDGTLAFNDLFTQHNEHRIFFPRIVALVLARLGHWDIRLEIWFGFLLLLAIGAVLLNEHLKAFGRTAQSAALFIPAAWLVFTLRQENNLLWGWQICIMMCSLAFCGAMALLSSSDQRRGRLAGAIACAVLCTFSFAAGLAVWPTGLVCLLWRLALVPAPELKAARFRSLAIWCAAATITGAVYLHGYVKPPAHPSTTYFVDHLFSAAYFFLLALGGSLTTELNVSNGVGMGLALVVVLGALAFATTRGWLDADKASFGVALIAFAAATAAMLTIGRSGFVSGPSGVQVGAGSRYTTLTLLGVVGVYWCCLSLKAGRLRLVLASAVGVLVFLGLFATLDSVYPVGTRVRRERQESRIVLLDWRNRSDAELSQLFPSPALVRERAAILETLQTGVFRDRITDPSLPPK